MSTAMLSKNSLPGHRLDDSQRITARQGTNSDSGQTLSDTHVRVATVGSTSPQAKPWSTPSYETPVGDQATDSGQEIDVTQTEIAAVGSTSVQPDPAKNGAKPTMSSPGWAALEYRRANRLLWFAARSYDDIEQIWMSSNDRIEQMTRPADKPDADGICRGFGLDDSHPEIIIQKSLLAGLAALKKETRASLVRTMKAHPLGPWIKTQVGIGELVSARLLAACGDPYWHPETLNDDGSVKHTEGPRRLYELYSYCGLVPGQKRARGQKSNWSTEAKSRAWVAIECAAKMNGVPNKHGHPRALSPYRLLIDERREHTAGRLHTTPCLPCGPKGSPADIGSPWSPAHSLADAMRIASKELLKDLWLEARRIHEEAA